MLSVEQIEEWVGQEVLDSQGERVGKLDEVFYSSTSGEAVFASIKSGLLGRHSSVVALAGASVGREHLRLAFSAQEIERAEEQVNVKDAPDHEQARQLAELYGVQVADGDSYEAASVINERTRAAEEARRGAEDLEEEARRRAAEAEQAQGEAQGAEQTAAQKAAEAERARTDAERARADAERMTPP